MPEAQDIDHLSAISRDDINRLRKDMIRFAMLQLRNNSDAEDAVQEALAGALASKQFAGLSELRTWVYSILRNKIVDIIRERIRHPTQSLTDEEGDDLDTLFDNREHWRKETQPAYWGEPDTVLENEQFWKIFEMCLNHLPESTARVFMMKEHLGLEIKQICEELVISESNCWVIMHRARMRLRLCLENNFI